jgi:molecular chaperone DnaJ
VLTRPNSYEVLKDDGKRRAFDNGGFSGMGEGGGGGSGFASGGFYGSGFESMGGNEAFANFWNQAFGGNDFSGFNPGRQQVVEVQVRLSFLEAANGCKRKVFVNIDKTCGTCAGTGAKSGTKPDKCKTCGGVGRVVKAKGPFQTIRCVLSQSPPAASALTLPAQHMPHVQRQGQNHQRSLQAVQV